MMIDPTGFEEVSTILAKQNWFFIIATNGCHEFGPDIFRERPDWLACEKCAQKEWPGCVMGDPSPDFCAITLDGKHVGTAVIPHTAKADEVRYKARHECRRLYPHCFSDKELNQYQGGDGTNYGAEILKYSSNQ